MRQILGCKSESALDVVDPRWKAVYALALTMLGWLRGRREQRRVSELVRDRLSALESAFAALEVRCDGALKRVRGADDLIGTVESIDRRVKIMNEQLLAGVEEALATSRRAMNTVAGGQRGKGRADPQMAEFGAQVAALMQTPEGRAHLRAQLDGAPNGADTGILGMTPPRNTL